MEKIAQGHVGKKLIQHEAKPSVVLGSRLTPECCIGLKTHARVLFSYYTML